MVDTILDANLHARLEMIGDRAGRIDQRTALMERALTRPAAQPFAFTTARDAITDTVVSDLVIGVGGPPQGQQWDIRRLVIGGVTYATSVGGTGLVVVAAQRPNTAAAVGLAHVVDNAASLPNQAFYGRGEIVLTFPDRLYVIVVGGTASTQYIAAAGIEQFEQAARVQTAGE